VYNFYSTEMDFKNELNSRLLFAELLMYAFLVVLDVGDVKG